MTYFFEDFRYHRVAAIGINQIGDLRNCFFAKFFSQFGEGLFIAIDHDDCCPFCQQGLGCCKPNTGCSACNCRDFSYQLFIHFNCPRFVVCFEICRSDS